MKVLLNIIKFKNKKGFSLTEIVTVIGLFAILVGSLAVFFIESIKKQESKFSKITASSVIQEITYALLDSKNNLWVQILDSTNDGPKHFLLDSNKYVMQDGKLIDGIIESWFEIHYVYRDEFGNIVEDGGEMDPNSRNAIIVVTITDSAGNVITIENDLLLTNWNTLYWHETSMSDFETNENLVDTIVTSRNDGSVELNLRPVIQGDWCNPTQTLTQYDLQRQGVPTSIFATPNYAYMGTGGNASGPSFDHVNISSDIPPVVTQLGTLTDSTLKVNDVFADEEYVYLASDKNSTEVAIIDIRTQPYYQIGFFDSPYNGDSEAVWVSGNTGFEIQNNRLYSFDITSKSSSRSQIGYIVLSADGSDMVIKDNYAYISLFGGTNDMEIIDVSNPASMVSIGYSNFTGSNTNTVFLSETGDRAYIGTDNASSGSEIFIIDTSEKTGSRSVVTSIESNGTSIKDLSVIHNRIIAVGENGEEYQVFVIDDEINPYKCGGLQFDNGLYGIETVVDEFETSWAYVLTGNSSSELLMIMGGPIIGGGSSGNGMGTSLIDYGEYESSVFDGGEGFTSYYLLSWSGEKPENNDIKIQLRSSNNPDLSGQSWIGPDGTSLSYFTQDNMIIPIILRNNRYIQYKVYFYGDFINTPIFENITIDYQK